MSDKHKVVKYVTSLGEEIEIVGVSPFEVDAVRNSVELPPVPTRDVVTAVSDYVEKEPLTADDLRNDEERAAWAKYQERLNTAMRERNELTTNFIFIEGTRFNQDRYQAWIDRRKRWRLPVPEDEMEAQIAYFRGAIVGSAEDIEYIMGVVMERQGVDEKTRQSIQATFRREVQRSTPDATSDAAGTVDVQPAVSGSQGDARVEDHTERVLQVEQVRPDDHGGVPF